MHDKWAWCVGGGAGDVWWEFLHSVPPMRMQYLVETYGCRIKVLVSTHNPGAADIFKYNPFISEVEIEEWHAPTPDDAIRYNNPIGSWWPLHSHDYFFRETGGFEVPLNRVELYLCQEEKRRLSDLLSQRPCIVAQPFAGLSDRDAYTPETLNRLIEGLVRLNPSVRVIVLGFNHSRGHKYTTETAIEHPNAIDLIDKCPLRLGYFLAKYCDAFTGAHSNLLRSAWDYRRPNALILPSPSMTDHWPKLDPKYSYGAAYPETRIFTYPFGEGVERNLNALDTTTIAKFLLGRA